MSDAKVTIILRVSILGVSALVKRVLLGDIGATNARFAIASKDVLGQVRSFQVAKFPQFTDALAVFLKEVSPPTHAIFAVAGSITGGCAKLTNHSWIIDAEELKNTLGLQTQIINDFRAVAL